MRVENRWDAMVYDRCLAAQEHCPGLKNKTIGSHTFRHSTAMSFLQAGVDLSIIKSWLGHVNLETTHSYVEINMKMKCEALKAAHLSIKNSPSLKKILDRNKDVLTWLSLVGKA
jgi:integrase